MPSTTLLARRAKRGGQKHVGRRARRRRKKREPGRGHYAKERPTIIAWVSRVGLVVVQAVKDCTVKTVPKAADVAVHAGAAPLPAPRNLLGTVLGL